MPIGTSGARGEGVKRFGRQEVKVTRGIILDLLGSSTFYGNIPAATPPSNGELE